MPSVGDVPIVDEAAQFRDRPIDERPLFGRRLSGRIVEQGVPVGLAAEQFGIPPHRTRIERFLLGL
jgi:hypothetical protein